MIIILNNIDYYVIKIHKKANYTIQKLREEFSTCTLFHLYYHIAKLKLDKTRLMIEMTKYDILGA